MVSRSLPSLVPERLGNVIAGELAAPSGWFEKVDPHTGAVLVEAARSTATDVDAAVLAAGTSQPAWSRTPGVQRGLHLHAVADELERRADEVAAIVSCETGKSIGDARGEVAGAVALGRFFAGEGQRLFGRTTQSSAPGRLALTVRDPVGVAGLIVPANTPIANVAWKVFPALICGNAVVLKSAEDAPATAAAFEVVARRAGLPAGILSVVHGYGGEAGDALVRHPGVGVVSFTGSTRTGRRIAVAAAERLARVSLELGGRNALVVCDDADVDLAVHWALLSAFSNAGQRCAAASRLLVFDGVYEQFRDRLVAKTSALRLGVEDTDDLGPVINEAALVRLLATVDAGVDAGARLLTGGGRSSDPTHRDGWYMAPTILEDVPPGTPLGCEELFGPVTVLDRVGSLEEAIHAVHASDYGLTASIHTRDWNRAMAFLRHVRTGVVSVNGGTYGSEPHMPFGGTGASGNGSREPGTEALDVYSELKTLYLNSDTDLVGERSHG